MCSLKNEQNYDDYKKNKKTESLENLSSNHTIPKIYGAVEPTCVYVPFEQVIL